MNNGEASRPPRRRRLLVWGGAALVAAVLLVPLFAWRPVLVGMAAWLDAGEPPQRTDYVVALPGEANNRPFVAAALINRGYAERAVLIPNRLEGQTRLTAKPPPDEVFRTVLVERGVAPEKIVTLDAATATTFGDAAAIARLLSDEPQATLTVVTSKFHMRRTRWSLERLLGESTERVRFVSAPMDGFDESDWWRNEDGFVYLAFEYLKLIFYTIRYGNGLAWLAGAAAVLAAGWLLRRRCRGKGLRRFSSRRQSRDDIRELRE